MIARRQFLAGLGAATVLGFDPIGRGWVRSAEAATFDGVPPLDGTLVMDPASIAAAADDVGNIIHRAPIAVLRPGSVNDIRLMVKFCRRHRIKVAARGQGHTTFGQAQVQGGLVIEMSALNQIHSIGPTSADVDAGVKWKDLVTASFAQGLTPPVLTGFNGLSVGGTLSVGGISATYNQGAQVDRVRALEVVTGEGDLIRCSASHRRDLFEAVLAGLGQCGIITRATLDLVPAMPQARVFLLSYTDNSIFFRDFRRLLNRGEFDRLFNIWFPDGAGGWIYQLNAVKDFDSSSPPNNAHLLRELSFDPSSAVVSDSTYLDQVLQVDAIIDFFRGIGLFDDVVHPWFDVFLPDHTVERYVGEVVPTLTPEDVGMTGFMLLFAQKRSRLTRPFLRVPERDDWVFLFDILTANSRPGPDPAFVTRMLNRNRVLFEKARRLGGTRYPIGALTFNQLDWILQYGREWPDFLLRKLRFDPARILTPGPGIF